jgi:hypothetical protein
VIVGVITALVEFKAVHKAILRHNGPGKRSKHLSNIFGGISGNFSQIGSNFEFEHFPRLWNGFELVLFAIPFAPMNPAKAMSAI